MVTGPEALDELLWGEHGAASGFTAQKTFINMSSVSPRYTRDLAGELEPLGVACIDAPVSGTKKPAEEGALLILAGGDQEKIAALAPIFAALGKRVIYCGPMGQGSMMKMTINLLLGVMMAGLAESLNFGLKNGLDQEAILDVILSGSLSNGLFGMRQTCSRTPDLPPQLSLKTYDQRPEIRHRYRLRFRRPDPGRPRHPATFPRRRRLPVGRRGLRRSLSGLAPHEQPGLNGSAQD